MSAAHTSTGAARGLERVHDAGERVARLGRLVPALEPRARAARCPACTPRPRARRRRRARPPDSTGAAGRPRSRPPSTPSQPGSRAPRQHHTDHRPRGYARALRGARGTSAAQLRCQLTMGAPERISHALRRARHDGVGSAARHAVEHGPRACLSRRGARLVPARRGRGAPAARAAGRRPPASGPATTGSRAPWRWASASTRSASAGPPGTTCGSRWTTGVLCSAAGSTARRAPVLAAPGGWLELPADTVVPGGLRHQPTGPRPGRGAGSLDGHRRLAAGRGPRAHDHQGGRGERRPLARP